MDRLDELLVLTAILESGTLAGAARRLRYSPPAVTRVLAALEQRVGARLIQRTTRHLTPTQAGRRLASHAKQLLGDYQQAVDGLKERREAPLAGILRVTAPSLFGRLRAYFAQVCKHQRTRVPAPILCAHSILRIDKQESSSIER